MRIGYGRVSTRDQNPAAQHDALTAASCDLVFIEGVTEVIGLGALDARSAWTA